MPLSDIGIIVEKYINTSYDVVKTVYDNLAAIRVVSGYILLQDTVLKTADESVTNSVILQDDDELLFALAADSVYEIEGWIKFTCASGTPDVKVHLTVPTGAVWDGGFVFYNSGNSQIDVDIYYNEEVSAILLGLDGTNDGFLKFRLSVVMASTAGNITFQFAQQNSNAIAIICKANSWLKSIKVT